MQEPRAQLTILHDDNSSFVDLSENMDDYGRDSSTIELISLEDKFYVGYEKPINTFYVELKVLNTNANTFTGKYFDGTSFVSLQGFRDYTKGWTRSGFMSWTRDQVNSSNQFNEEKTTINGVEQYWYELVPSADHLATTELQGVNLVFADDEDLRGEIPEIDSFRNENELSYILVHQSVRNELIQDLRNKGRLKSNNSSSNSNNFNLKNIIAWDLLDRLEVRLAAKFWALEKIFFNVSDSIDDKLYQRYNDYRALRNEAYQLFFMSLDLDDDGITDSNEQLDLKRTEISRV